MTSTPAHKLDDWEKRHLATLPEVIGAVVEAFHLPPVGQGRNGRGMGEPGQFELARQTCACLAKCYTTASIRSALIMLECGSTSRNIATAEKAAADPRFLANLPARDFDRAYLAERILMRRRPHLAPASSSTQTGART